MKRWFFLGPFLSFARNETKPRSDFVFFPFVRIGDGTDYCRRSFWPFYGYLREGGIRREYVLWPFWRTERRETPTSRMRGFATLAYESLSTEREDKEGTLRTEHRNILWPLWYSKRDEEGNTYLMTLNLAVHPRPQGWDRFLTFIWRIFEHETRPPLAAAPSGTWRSTRALWGAFRYDRDAASHRLRVFPLFTSRRGKDRSGSFHVLAGLFGYGSRPGKRTYTILFIPWTVHRGDDQ